AGIFRRALGIGHYRCIATRGQGDDPGALRHSSPPERDSSHEIRQKWAMFRLDEKPRPEVWREPPGPAPSRQAVVHRVRWAIHPICVAVAAFRSNDGRRGTRMRVAFALTLALVVAAAISLPASSTAPGRGSSPRLRILVRVDVDPTVKDVAVADILAEARRIWAPYVDLEFVDAADLVGSSHDDEVRLFIT